MTTYDYDCDCDPCFQTGPFISSGEKQFQSIEPQKNLHGSHETLPLKVFIKKKKCTGTYMIKEYPKNQDRPNKAGQTECVKLQERFTKSQRYVVVRRYLFLMVERNVLRS